jgi:hypothetical protein
MRENCVIRKKKGQERRIKKERRAKGRKIVK